MLITFSGLDGSGKTTLINSLKKTLEKNNFRVTSLSMYGHVSLYGIIRFLRTQIFSLTRKRKYPSFNVSNIGSEERKGNRLHNILLNILRKNFTKRCVLVIDIFILLIFRIYIEIVKQHVFVLDRYFYDFLADVADGRRWRYIKSFVHVAPTPNVAFFVDVNPDTAFLRKGEYTIPHLKRRHKIYMRIFQWVPNQIFIQNDDLHKTKKRIEKIVLNHLAYNLTI